MSEPKRIYTEDKLKALLATAGKKKDDWRHHYWQSEDLPKRSRARRITQITLFSEPYECREYVEQGMTTIYCIPQEGTIAIRFSSSSAAERVAFRAGLKECESIYSLPNEIETGEGETFWVYEPSTEKTPERLWGPRMLVIMELMLSAIIVRTFPPNKLPDLELVWRSDKPVETKRDSLEPTEEIGSETILWHQIESADVSRRIMRRHTERTPTSDRQQQRLIVLHNLKPFEWWRGSRGGNEYIVAVYDRCVVATCEAWETTYVFPVPRRLSGEYWWQERIASNRRRFTTNHRAIMVHHDDNFGRELQNVVASGGRKIDPLR